MTGQLANPIPSDPQTAYRLLERRVSDLELQLADDQLVRLRQQFSQPVLAEKAQYLVQQSFGIDRFQLQGMGQARKGGRRTAQQQLAEHTLEVARLWLISLLRQCDCQSYSHIVLAYPWVNSRRYMDAGQHIVAIYNDPSHPDRQQWISLLISLRVLLSNSGLTTAIVDEEIAFANRSGNA